MPWNRPTRIIAPRIVHSPCAMSTHTNRAIAGFGLIAHRSTSNQHSTKPTRSQINIINNSTMILITGASGSGKSSLIAGIKESSQQLSRKLLEVATTQTQLQSSLIDLLTGSLQSRLDTLARAGLAEPRLWAMPPSCLSVGERARFALAITMHQANPGDLLIADEFASTIDRTNAYALSKLTARWARQVGVTVIAASAHEDLETMLDPDWVFDLNTKQDRKPIEQLVRPIQIELGHIDDYRALEHLHYLGTKPATITKVIKATVPCPILGSSLVGVLVISMPTLNNAWRKRAWPGVFNSGDKRADAKAINANLRCISRVIVNPAHRGLGVASQLVRHYLSSPQTIATEAIASMGSTCPFFERAGMTAYSIPPNIADLRLIDALTHQQRSPEDLIGTPIQIDSHLEYELIRWGKARRLIAAGTTRDQTIQSIAPIAACRLLASPRAYAHVNEHTNADTA